MVQPPPHSQFVGAIALVQSRYHLHLHRHRHWTQVFLEMTPKNNAQHVFAVDLE